MISKIDRGGVLRRRLGCENRRVKQRGDVGREVLVGGDQSGGFLVVGRGEK
jgi:hypothetical protein